uniref:Progesterone receptor membrane component 2 n=1 Tax=Latimeria chalumnae TaxID=7897 RepID=H3AEB8_LATCH
FCFPLHFFLICFCYFNIFRCFLGVKPESVDEIELNMPPRMKSPATTEGYNSMQIPCILLAVNRKVFDVAKGKKFYGCDVPDGKIVGRDLSRGLATCCLSKAAQRDKYDDLSDLNAMQMQSVREWEIQFMGKYDYIGQLLKPGDDPSE